MLRAHRMSSLLSAARLPSGLAITITRGTTATAAVAAADNSRRSTAGSSVVGAAGDDRGCGTDDGDDDGGEADEADDINTVAIASIQRLDRRRLPDYRRRRRCRRIKSRPIVSFRPRHQSCESASARALCVRSEKRSTTRIATRTWNGLGRVDADAAARRLRDGHSYAAAVAKTFTVVVAAAAGRSVPWCGAPGSTIAGCGTRPPLSPVSQSVSQAYTHTHTHERLGNFSRRSRRLGNFCVVRLPLSKHSRGRSVARRNSLGCENFFFWRPTFRRTDRHSLWSSARPPTESQLFSAPHTNFSGGRRPIVDRVAKACRPLHTDQAGRGRASRVIADFAPHESARGTATAPRVRPKTATRRESVSGFGRGSAKAASPTVPRPSRSRSVAAGHCGFCATRVWRAR